MAGGPERRRRTVTSRWQPYNHDKFKRVAGYRGTEHICRPELPSEASRGDGRSSAALASLSSPCEAGLVSRPLVWLQKGLMAVQLKPALAALAWPRRWRLLCAHGHCPATCPLWHRLGPCSRRCLARLGLRALSAGWAVSAELTCAHGACSESHQPGALAVLMYLLYCRTSVHQLCAVLGVTTCV